MSGAIVTQVRANPLKTAAQVRKELLNSSPSKEVPAKKKLYSSVARLVRQQKENGTYERVRRWHSWNSNHVLGRIVLFELSRHSDHHYKADRPYQLLESHEESPTMPTGYPGMMLMAVVPPLFFKVMGT